MLSRILRWNRNSGCMSFVPMRAPAKKKNVQEKKKKDSAEEKDKLAETRYLPYIPPAYVADTVSFFKDKNKVDNLLSLIFGPQNSTDSHEDRVEYQKRFELYQFLKQREEEKYERHLLKMKEKIFKAVENLPEELYDESIQSGEPFDHKEIQFGLKYEKDIVKGLSSYRQKLLHVYKILLYLRFPFYLIKKKKPMLFYISESKAISRQKQINAQRKKLKKK
ncbi:conserved Plasmodium protein, unknown function [Plasmodium vivax]|uniref:Uncharacterized protein n=6 Tax=Plasmodium vivax TaxID=5855 RepID=A5KDU1_PLAVS|nr:hypothetical protein, conserved [Plasmodium vivax]KMZ81618.1 hypothetical protein PVIIG_04707 [Plasmodium vivax India VII]KMZ87835.1 hypothetical protein PVBG_05086 [Plasmodium vivax Brazil I]KMZ94094.1 hypothetical protein PVMG_02320 [Plasmodium vivax Mauritania I]KNA00645.1 hypothetical protein PVNG_03242 [Plasmodium vivax North Korean]EDL42387.1 hypothetical protein, conserved [Plasmodium vivax]|eukprot:XP_001608411.1 hypothetical protein [Plasmodium vivax Sal-1]